MPDLITLFNRGVCDAVQEGPRDNFANYRAIGLMCHYHQPVDSCRITAEDPPHSEGHLCRGNRDGASALTERRDDVFGAISRQTRRHPGRHLQPSVFYARVGKKNSGCTTSQARALAAPPCVT